jgi:pimeloyl-ACP methyl ester carboxylesterase
LLKKARIPAPYVVVGFSIGGLIGRLYMQKYPDDAAGMVIVDHAFVDVGSDVTPESPVSPDRPPMLIYSTPITLGIEDDRNFMKLPQLNRDLHAWAMSIHPVRPTGDTASECSSAVESVTIGQPYPMGDKPLVVIRTNNDLPAYQRLQARLLLLSHQATQIFAENSSHMVIIDQPEVVTASIQRVVKAAGKKLGQSDGISHIHLSYIVDRKLKADSGAWSTFWSSINW